MSSNFARMQAISAITNRVADPVEATEPLEEIWATDVFTLTLMEEVLTTTAFKAVKKAFLSGGELDPAAAEPVAAAMKNWAISKGAKFFSHIFYPLTGRSAEKHDGFIISSTDGKAITEFAGELLIKGEPDGSSFPNGGLRSTDAARGYTAWDPSSPAYIQRTANGATLVIPSVFLSWTGESLGTKTPLLRSNVAVDKAARKVLALMGEEDIATVSSSCGAEQEYFLIDENFVNARPDLLLAGRTLFGASPAKGQEFDDHYFGAIPTRVQNFMQDFEDKLYRLGIPAKTHHNEVAPGQFEIAPYYETANIAADHQQLMMTTMQQTAKQHGFACLLHEKPFAGINGSGKHVNWSVGNATQGNLLDPGDTPHQNLNFLLFCGAVIRGVHKYGPLLRAVIASAANDHRLGANEAPPAILSVYLGSQLESIFKDIQSGKLRKKAKGKTMDLRLAQLLSFTADPGDRNRTSPFAFTGNRFEFRACGSSNTVSTPLIAMNAMLADSLEWIAGRLKKALKTSGSKTDAVIVVLQELMERHGNAVFGGDGYSSKWHKEAVEKRGLLNLPTTADALPYYKDKDIVKLFTSTDILSAKGVNARFEVAAEQYIMAIEVEAKLVVDMATTQIYPAALSQIATVSGAAGEAESLGLKLDTGALKETVAHANGLNAGVEKLKKALTKHFKTPEKHMRFCADTICPLMLEIREHADALEGLVGDELWPLPKYAEMLNIK